MLLGPEVPLGYEIAGFTYTGEDDVEQTQTGDVLTLPMFQSYTVEVELAPLPELSCALEFTDVADDGVEHTGHAVVAQYWGTESPVPGEIADEYVIAVEHTLPDALALLWIDESSSEVITELDSGTVEAPIANQVFVLQTSQAMRFWGADSRLVVPQGLPMLH